MSLIPSFTHEKARRAALAVGVVVPDSGRCIQCGICSFNCPAEIDVRRHVRLGRAVIHRNCLTCAECIARCPRGVLHFESSLNYNAYAAQRS